ncbi:MAG: hypothetical protein IPG22_05630 [Acidobacteria bacterium]|nr:hypothetical protein [Acidobacteriota bacterium]
MASRKKEIAKFFCGFEAFHALFHATLLLSGTTITVFGIPLAPTWNIVPLTVNVLLTIALANYAWGWYQRNIPSNLGNSE